MASWISAFATLTVELVTTISGDVRSIIIATRVLTRKPSAEPIARFIGANVSQKLGKISNIGKKLVQRGNTRSL